jgi:2-methylisocitrate lyase-like PEP mutase family enzyme
MCDRQPDPRCDKGERFRDLHSGGAFVIPNPWDAGSARILEGLGFEALATTSSGFAQTLGRLDGTVSLEEKVEHCRALCVVTNIPVSADLENGFGHSPEAVARAIRMVAGAGVVGASIEDFDGAGIYEHAAAVERIAAAAEAARSLPFPFTLTARAENLLRGVDDLDDTIRRLQDFEAAGADVLYAPGLTTLEQVRTLCASVSRPVNVLAPFLRGVTVAELGAAGARRISIGGALALAALAPVLAAGVEMQDRGSFDWLDGLGAAGDARQYLRGHAEMENAR